jgi:methanogenic corrinoid protein MtbC1
MLRNGSGESMFNIGTAFGSAKGDSDASEAQMSGQQNAANDDMASLIEDEVIPRLIAAHRAPAREMPRPASTVDHDAALALDPDAVADLALSSEPGAVQGLVEEALAQGVPLETLLIEILAPAARRLGDRWQDDSADFIAVTMGLWRLQESLQGLGNGRRPLAYGRAAGRPGRRVLFVVAPGDTHSFGSVLLEELFRDHGWECRSCRGATAGEIGTELESHMFDLVALSASVSDLAPGLIRLVADMRRRSCNPDLAVLVGGPVFAAHPGLAARVGADGTAGDARSALLAAEELVRSIGAEAQPFQGEAFADPWRQHGPAPG